MTKEEAIERSVQFAETYNTVDDLNDAQAARIGRELWANLLQAERETHKEKEYAVVVSFIHKYFYKDEAIRYAQTYRARGNKTTVISAEIADILEREEWQDLTKL